MNRSMKLHRIVIAGILAAVAVWPLAQAAHAGPPAPAVPSTIAVPAGNKPFLVGHAVGVQIYRCDAVAGAYRWTFVAPRADLFDGKGKHLTTHFAGPSWRAKDGSLVTARRVDGVTVDPTAIPWLLLAAASTMPGPDGNRLTQTTFIQRIETTGGLSTAAADCNESTAGTIDGVDYTADYVFWKAAGK